MRVTVQVCMSVEAQHSMRDLGLQLRDQSGPVRWSASRLAEAIIVAAATLPPEKVREWSPQDEGRYTTLSVDSRTPNVWFSLLNNYYNGRKFLFSYLLRQPEVVAKAKAILTAPYGLDTHLTALAGPSVGEPKARTAKVSIRLPEDVWRLMEATAKRSDLSIAEFVSRAIVEKLSEPDPI